MSKHEFGLIMMHIPVGIGAAAALLVHWSISLAIVIGFFVYEVVQMTVFLVDEYQQAQLIPRRIRVKAVLDRAYPEIAGCLIGIGIGAVVLWILNYLGVDMHMFWR